MSYYVEVLGAEITIRKERYIDAINCLTKLFKQPFSLRLVDTDAVNLILDNDGLPDERLGRRDYEKLIDIFLECGYDFDSDDHCVYFDLQRGSSHIPGGVSYVSLEARLQRWSDDEKLFAALASTITDGSYIEFRGECGALWQYSFNGTDSFTKQYGKILWVEEGKPLLISEV